jgi:small subunit ribosomal protein S17
MSSAKPTGGKGKSSASTSETPKTPRTTRAKAQPKTAEAKTTKAAEKTEKVAKAPRAPRVAKPKTTEQAAASVKASHRQQKTGRVVSNKMDKTIVVVVETLKRHPLYKRTYKATTKFKAHDEHNEALPGDMVRIEETRPISKDKRWRLVEITKRAVQAPSVAQVVSQLDPQTSATEER